MKRIPKGQSNTDNREKPALYGTQDEDKHTTTQYVLVTVIRKQTHI